MAEAEGFEPRPLITKQGFIGSITDREAAQGIAFQGFSSIPSDLCDPGRSLGSKTVLPIRSQLRAFYALHPTECRPPRPASGKSELIEFDEAMPGFGIRIRQGGKRTWIAQYGLERSSGASRSAPWKPWTLTKPVSAPGKRSPRCISAGPAGRKIGSPSTRRRHDGHRRDALPCAGQIQVARKNL